MSHRIGNVPVVVNRREFTLQSAMALLAGVVITIDGCGGKSPAAPAPVVNDVNGAISANHGHTAVVEAAKITAGNAISLDIRGTASHPHTVELSQAEMTMLRNRQVVSKDSTNNNNHMHTVTFTPV